MFDNVKIEKDIPIPENTKTRTGLWKYLAETMEIGNSVFLKDPPKDKKGNLAVMTRLYSYKPKKFTCRPEGDGARLWRIK